MVRNYIRKTGRGTTPRSVLEKAREMVVVEKKSVRSVAAQFEINHMTLTRFIMKAKKLGVQRIPVGYYGNRKIFNELQEAALERYLLNASFIYFGLTPKEVRTLAYGCAEVFEISMPESWLHNKCAGKDWLSSFMKRHPRLAIRTPEATSLSRATSFNTENVNLFFTKLGEVLDRHSFTGNDIWNVDETGITTVQKPRRIVGSKGIKQVGALTSAERGALVTVCGAVNAIGNSIPPMMVFPRKNFKDHFIRDGPTGCIGAAHPSGWMTSENFLKFLQHFVRFAKPTTDKPVLLLLDNHHSHLAVEILAYAKVNGIVMLSFPPHCSHRLQPLDRSVYGPLKRYVSSAQDAWMRNNPGVPMTIYDIPSVLRESWGSATVPKNIIKGFEVSGIFPFNPNIFTDTDFAPSYVTDRPMPEQREGTNSQKDADYSHTAAVNNDSLVEGRESTDTTQDSNNLTDTQSVSQSLDTFLARKGRQLVRVRGDGHCILHAAEVCINSEDVQTVTHDALCVALRNEIQNHKDVYKPFVEEDRDILEDIDKYIREKEYDTSSVDLVLAALCNAFQLKIVVYKVTDTSISEVEQTPGRHQCSAGGTIYLVHHGSGAGAHYDAAISDRERSAPVPQPSHPFAPEDVRPFPKARPRKNPGKRTAKKRKTAILTDTPEKEAIEAEFRRRTKKPVKDKRGKKSARPFKKSSKENETESSDDEEWFCLVCAEPYSNSRSREVWIQCVSCKDWAHKDCTSGSPVYECQNCDSCDDF